MIITTREKRASEKKINKFVAFVAKNRTRRFNEIRSRAEDDRKRESQTLASLHTISVFSRTTEHVHASASSVYAPNFFKNAPAK